MATSLARNVGNLGNVLSTNGQYATQKTPPVLDSSTNLATTAFVKGSGRTYAGVFSYGASTALSTAQTGALVQVSTGGLTLTLPSIDNCPPGTTISFLNPLTSGNVTLKGNATELIASPFTVGANTLVLYPHETLDIVSTTTTWVVVGYAQLNAPGFTAPTVSSTPGHFDNSTLIPNTAWHSIRGMAFNSQTAAISTTPTTLTATHVGGAFYFNLSGTQAVTMPDPTTVAQGSQITLFTSNATTLNVSGSGTNLDLGNGVFASFSMPGSNTVTFVRGAGASWLALGVYPFNRNYLSATVNNINASISNEASARASVDGSLQDQINNEVTNRSNADNNLQSQINSIRSVQGIGSFAIIQGSQWQGNWSTGGTGTANGYAGNWQLTSTTQISGDNIGIGYRYA